MTRRAEQIPLDDDWVLTKVWHRRHSAAAILAAVNAVPPDKAFIPKVGEPFDPPEPGDSPHWPPNCDGLNSPEPVSASNSPEAVAEVLLARTEGDE